ncbi:hypothetical protein BCR42DRAFT_489057 [Absidia repens]|uniref:Uncharacterized protein n=1 Tax=Absidia repens TaxID=90262 RepID=A0A1X2IQK1_9FUNG|nr:hypothetical protein BCR42DRAFT_489057 [Absidia repens]
MPSVEVAKSYKNQNIPCAIIANNNYSEGSVREPAVLQIIYFIHETNLETQDALRWTFANDTDRELISDGDMIEASGVKFIVPEKSLQLLMTTMEWIQMDN